MIQVMKQHPLQNLAKFEKETLAKSAIDQLKKIFKLIIEIY